MPRIKSPERLIGQKLFTSHKIYPLAMRKELHRKDVRSRRSATPKFLSAKKKFWSTCGPSHFIRLVTSIAGSVWGIVISICRPYSTTHRECERAPDASSAIPPRRYEEHEKFEQFRNLPLIIFCSYVNCDIHSEPQIYESPTSCNSPRPHDLFTSTTDAIMA